VRTDLTPYSVAVILDFIRLWREYQEECDSVFLYDDGFERERMTVARYRETQAIWRSETPLNSLGHWCSSPPTLPGFMEFLERKINGGKK